MQKKTDLSVCLFGSHPILAGGAPLNISISGPTKKLFYYLLLSYRKEIRREYLAELFWRDTDICRQRSALNSAIWRIKKQIDQLAGIEIKSDGEFISLQLAENIFFDSMELRETVKIASTPSKMGSDVAGRLANILNLCDGPFMNGVVEDWALAERERLYNIQLRGFTLLMRWLGKQREYEEALDIGRRLLIADPFREAAQCEVMWLYVLNGQRAQSLKQYRNFEQLLKSELDIEPMPETHALYEYIRSELDFGALKKASGNFDAPNWSSSKELNTLLDAIDQSRRHLYQTICEQIS